MPPAQTCAEAAAGSLVHDRCVTSPSTATVRVGAGAITPPIGITVCPPQPSTTQVVGAARERDRVEAGPLLALMAADDVAIAQHAHVGDAGAWMGIAVAGDAVAAAATVADIDPLADGACARPLGLANHQLNTALFDRDVHH